MASWTFKSVKPGDVLKLDYSINTSKYAISNQLYSSGITGSWNDDYTQFTVATISGNSTINLTAEACTPIFDFSSLSLGTTFNYGKYQVETEDPWDIEWEVVHQDDQYNYCQTKQIIDLRAFDAKESNNPNSFRSGSGNNNWQYSNIEQFLNSDQEVWYSAQHEYDAPPSGSNLMKGYNPYDTHKGFLYYFSYTEKEYLQDMTLTLANPTVDGGGSYTWTGKVWLPTYTQITGAPVNSISEGFKFDKYSNNIKSRIKTINKYCAENNPYCINDNETEGTAYGYWLSTANVSDTYYSMFVRHDGTIADNVSVYGGHRGLAPCILLPRNA